MSEGISRDVLRTIDTLLAQIEAEIVQVNRVGSEAFEASDYGEARRAAKRATALAGFRDRVVAMRGEFQNLVAEGPTVTPARTSSRAAPIHRQTEPGTTALPDVLIDVLAVVANYRHHRDWVRAYQQRAREKDVARETIRDACTRRQELNTTEFCRLLDQPQELRQHLVSRYPGFAHQIDEHLGHGYGTP